MGRFAEAVSRFDRALLACPHGDGAADCRERREKASSVLCAQARAARGAASARSGCGGGSGSGSSGGVGDGDGGGVAGGLPVCGEEEMIELRIPFAARGDSCVTRVDSVENVVADAAAARRALCSARATARQRAKGGEEGGEGGEGAEGVEEDDDGGDKDDDDDDEGGLEGAEVVGSVGGRAGGAVGVVRLSLQQLAVAGTIGGKLWDASLLLSSMVKVPSLVATHRSGSPPLAQGDPLGLRGEPSLSGCPRDPALWHALWCPPRADSHRHSDHPGSPRGLASTRHASRRPPPRRTCRRLACSSWAQASESPG